MPDALGQYRIGERIGAGATSVVVAATHEVTGEEVAIKRLLADRAVDPRLVERFDREARAASRVKSARVVRILEHGVDAQGLPYLVLERLFGETLMDRLRKKGLESGRSHPPASALTGPEATRFALEVTAQILEGLADLHAMGVVHRDLKPSNVFLCQHDDERVDVKLVDLGVAKSEIDAAMTRTGEMLGSVSFMAPEQIRRARAVSPAADLWSVGVLLHRMLAGKNPFTAGDPMSLVTQILTEPGARLPDDTDGRERVQAIVDRALAKAPEARYPSASAMREAVLDLDDAARERPSEGHRSPPPIVDEPSSMPVVANIGEPAEPPLEATPTIVAEARESRRPRGAAGSRRSLIFLAAAAILGIAGGWLPPSSSRDDAGEPASIVVEGGRLGALESGRAEVITADGARREIVVPERPGLELIVRAASAPSAAASTARAPAAAETAAPPASVTSVTSAPASEATTPARPTRSSPARPRPPKGAGSTKRPPVIYEPPY